MIIVKTLESQVMEASPGANRITNHHDRYHELWTIEYNERHFSPHAGASVMLQHIN